MNEINVNEAFRYFSKTQNGLGFGDQEIENCFFDVESKKKALFLVAIIDEIITSTTLSDEVKLGGLTLVVDWSYSDLPYSIFSEETDRGIREEIVNKFYDCFKIIFASRCKDDVSDKMYSSDWNSLCFMWWELLPRHGNPYRKDLVEIDFSLMESLKLILLLDNKICKESALHGLGHWYPAYPDKVNSIIMECIKHVPNELMDYAMAAAQGNIQ